MHNINRDFDRGSRYFDNCYISITILGQARPINFTKDLCSSKEALILFFCFWIRHWCIGRYNKLKKGLSLRYFKILSYISFVPNLSISLFFLFLSLSISSFLNCATMFSIRSISRNKSINFIKNVQTLNPWRIYKEHIWNHLKGKSDFQNRLAITKILTITLFRVENSVFAFPCVSW